MNDLQELDNFNDWTGDKVYPSLQNNIDLNHFSFIGGKWNDNMFNESILNKYPEKDGPERFFGYFSNFFSNKLNVSNILDFQSHFKILNLYLISEKLMTVSNSDNILSVYINHKLPESLSNGYCLPYLPWVQFVLEKGDMKDTFESLSDFNSMYINLKNIKKYESIQVDLSSICQIPFYSKNIISKFLDWPKSFLSRDPKFLSYCLANNVFPIIKEPGITLYVDNPLSIHYHRMAFISNYVSDLINLDSQFGMVLSFACIPSNNLMEMIYEIEDYFVVSDTNRNLSNI